MILTFRPIRVWPDSFNRTRFDRENSPFSATYSDTLILLERELAHLGASEVVLQVDASERDVRLDGQLRADAKVNHPGVILTIETRRHGTLVYATDRYQQPGYRRTAGESWQHNLRAIALGLEALRKIERYGIAERGQQYAGYRELGSGIELGAAPMTAEDAAKFITNAGDPDADPDDWKLVLLDLRILPALYRAAAARLHPDKGGDEDAFKRLTAARDLLAARRG